METIGHWSNRQDFVGQLHISFMNVIFWNLNKGGKDKKEDVQYI